MKKKKKGLITVDYVDRKNDSAEIKIQIKIRGLSLE